MNYKKTLLAILITAGIVIGGASYALPSLIYNNTNVQFKRAVLDVASSTGSAGQCFTSTGTSTLWAACTAGGGSVPPGVVATSTANYFTYYLNGTTVTGTVLMQLTAGTITFSSTTAFSNLTATGITSTNENVSLLSYTNASGSSATTTNVSSTNSYSNSYTGNWAGNIIPILYGGTNSSTVGSNGCVKYSDGVGMNCTAVGSATQLLSSNGAGVPLWISSTSLNYLALTGGTLSGSLIFTSATGTSVTTTNFYTPSAFTAGSITISSSTIAAYPSVSGSTTIPLGIAMANQTWQSYGCFTTSTGGTLATSTVYFGNGFQTWMTAIQATSSLAGSITPITTVSANNTFVKGAQRYVQFGNIVGVYNSISCSYKYSYDPT